MLVSGSLKAESDIKEPAGKSSQGKKLGLCLEKLPLKSIKPELECTISDNYSVKFVGPKMGPIPPVLCIGNTLRADSGPLIQWGRAAVLPALRPQFN